MGGENDFERFEERLRFPGALEQIVDLALVPLGHRGNDGLFVGKITVDQPDTDPGLGTDVVHAGLVEPASSKADNCGLKNLGATIDEGNVSWDWRHRGQ